MITPKPYKDRWRAQAYIKELKKYYPIYGKTKEECENNIIKFLNDKINGILPETCINKNKQSQKSMYNTNDYTIKNFIELYIDFLQEKVDNENLLKNTMNDYIGCITKNMPEILNLKIEEITLEFLKNNFTKIREESGISLMHRVKNSLYPYFSKLAKTKKIEYNYLDEIEFPNKKTNKHAICSTKSLKILIELLKNEKDREYLYILVLLCSFFGTRISEALAIDYKKSFDRENKILSITQQQTKEKGKGYFIVDRTKTKKGNRSIFCLEVIMQEIDKYYLKQEKYFEIKGIQKDEKYKDLLLLNKNGSMIKENTAHRHWNKLLKKYQNDYNLPEKITFHSFRRYFAEWLREQNVDNKVIKEFMGHEKEDMTEYYQYQNIEYAQKEMEKVKTNIII